MPCPICGKKHYKYPENCVTISRNEYSLIVIAKVAGGITQTSRQKDIVRRHDFMEKYIKQFTTKLKKGGK